MLFIIRFCYAAFAMKETVEVFVSRDINVEKVCYIW